MELVQISIRNATHSLLLLLLQYLKIIMKNAISSSSLMVDAKIHCTVCPKYLR